MNETYNRTQRTCWRGSSPCRSRSLPIQGQHRASKASPTWALTHNARPWLAVRRGRRFRRRSRSPPAAALIASTRADATGGSHPRQRQSRTVVACHLPPRASDAARISARRLFAERLGPGGLTFTNCRPDSSGIGVGVGSCFACRVGDGARLGRPRIAQRLPPTLRGIGGAVYGRSSFWG